MSKPIRPDTESPGQGYDKEERLAFEQVIAQWLETVQARMNEKNWVINEAEALVLYTFSLDIDAFTAQLLLLPFFPGSTERQLLELRERAMRYLRDDFSTHTSQRILREEQVKTLIDRYLALLKGAPIDVAMAVTGKSEQELKPHLTRYPGGSQVNLLDVFKNTPR